MNRQRREEAMSVRRKTFDIEHDDRTSPNFAATSARAAIRGCRSLVVGDQGLRIARPPLTELSTRSSMGIISLVPGFLLFFQSPGAKGRGTCG